VKRGPNGAPFNDLPPYFFFFAAGFLAAGFLAAGFLAAGFSWWLKAGLLLRLTSTVGF
jgi:hypothetical protein